MRLKGKLIAIVAALLLGAALGAAAQAPAKPAPKPIVLEVTWTLDLQADDGSFAKIVLEGKYEVEPRGQFPWPCTGWEPERIRDGESFCFWLKYLGGRLVHGEGVGQGEKVTFLDEPGPHFAGATGLPAPPSTVHIQGMNQIVGHGDGNVTLHLDTSPGFTWPESQEGARELALGCWSEGWPVPKLTYAELRNLSRLRHAPWSGPVFSPEIGGCHGTLTVEIRVTGEEEVELKIIKPEPNSEQVFQASKLVIEAEAKVEPAQDAAEVTWEVDDVQGSTKTIKPAKGPKVTITFDKLPADNNQFGEKTITARLRGKQDQVKIRVFFRRDDQDNPGGKEPNWFYYWRQGAVPGLERFRYEPNEDHGEYKCEQKLLIVGRGDAGVLVRSVLELGPVQIPGKGLCTPLRIESPETEGIDSVARVVSHELEHERIVQKTNCGKNRAVDRDHDGILDTEEKDSPYCLDPMNDDTHGLHTKVPGSQIQDDEILAIAAEGKVKADHAKDWAYPGSQSKKGK